MAQYVVKKGDTLSGIAQKVFGDANRWRDLGYTGDPKKLQTGTVLNYGGPSAPAPAASPAPSSAPAQNSYTKLLEDWYSQKPATPAPFLFSPQDEAAAKQSVGQEYRPYYQEQIDYSNQDFARTLDNARQGLSRRGLWGAASNPNQSTTIYAADANSAPTGPVSGLRQVAETRIEGDRAKAQTAYERAYNEAVAGGVQQRRAQQEDVYNRTIQDPYKQAFADWQSRLALLQRGY